MGILNELRDEASKQKEEDKIEEFSKQLLEHKYQNEILPKIQMIFNYFKEIVEHLQFLKNPIVITEYSKSFPQFGTLSQQEYKLSTDDFGGHTKYDEMRQVILKFYCMGEGSFTFDAKSQHEIDQTVALFTSKKIPFDWSRNYNNVDSSSATFEVVRKIPVRIAFAVDYDKSIITLQIQNHLNFDKIQRSYKAEEITEELLDQIANFLLRKNNDFIAIEISDEEREQIRQKLIESARADQKYKEQLNQFEPKEKSLFGKLTSIFKS